MDALLDLAFLAGFVVILIWGAHLYFKGGIGRSRMKQAERSNRAN